MLHLFDELLQFPLFTFVNILMMIFHQNLPVLLMFCDCFHLRCLGWSLGMDGASAAGSGVLGWVSICSEELGKMSNVWPSF